ncbi:hypothetical protein GCM10010431_54980 [Streptomyces kunmingensis]
MRWWGREPALSQFGCTAEVEVAPGSVLAAVAQLFEGVGEQMPGRGVLGVGEDHVGKDLGCPPVVAYLERLSQAGCRRAVRVTSTPSRVPQRLTRWQVAIA